MRSEVNIIEAKRSVTFVAARRTNTAMKIVIDLHENLFLQSGNTEAAAGNATGNKGTLEDFEMLFTFTMRPRG